MEVSRPTTRAFGAMVTALAVAALALGCASATESATELAPAATAAVVPTVAVAAPTEVVTVPTAAVVPERLTPTPLPTLPPTATAVPEPTATPTPAITPTPNPYTAISLIQTPLTDADPPMYMTFDDGPHPEWTIQVLDLLDQYDVTATFFVTGQEVERHPDIAREIDARGHSLANHTWRHRAITNLSDAQLIESLQDTTAMIEEVTGQVVRCFRPPFADINGRTRAVVQGQGLDVHTWDVGSLDWEYRDPDSIIRAVLPLAPPGSDVLMHDGGGNRAPTVEALRNILEVWDQADVTYTPIPGCETS